MKSATQAYAELGGLNRPVVTTREAAARLTMTHGAANKLLSRLAAAHLAQHVTHGIWALGPNVSANLLPEYLTAPYPAYISLWSALYLHSMIDQVPNRIFVASLSRAREVRTSVGTFAIHHIPPYLFGGWSQQEQGKVADPPKALFDTLYLRSHRGVAGIKLPEIEFPDDFDATSFEHWVAKVPSKKMRTVVTEAFRYLRTQPDRRK